MKEDQFWISYKISCHLLLLSYSLYFTFSLSVSIYMKFRNEVYKLSSGGARQILRLISTGGTQSR